MWEDLDEDQFGSAHQLELTGFAEPVRLDPTVNLTPLLRDRGGVVKLNNSYSFLGSALANVFDGCSGIPPLGCAPRPCALRRAASPCMRRPGSRPMTGWGLRSCAAMSPDPPWRRDDCASSTPTSFPSSSRRPGQTAPPISCSRPTNCSRNWPPSYPHHGST